MTSPILSVFVPHDEEMKLMEMHIRLNVYRFINDIQHNIETNPNLSWNERMYFEQVINEFIEKLESGMFYDIWKTFRIVK